jgi:YidC/Oxa1 family membrane protein insertase
METKRLVLYVLLGVICFALWNAWQKDYAPITTLNSEQQQTLRKDADAKSQSGKEADSKKQAQQNGNNNADNEAISPTTNNQTANITKVPAERLIHVRTDVLDVAIDSKGGNLVSAKLLQYKETLGQPNPVAILSDDENNLYLAESGLISEHGPDTKKAQGQYTVEKKNYVLSPNGKTLEVKLHWDNGKGLNVEKIFLFTANKYDIKVNYIIDNKSDTTFSGKFYAQLRHKNVEVKTQHFGYASTFIGATLSSSEDPYEKISYKKLGEETINREVKGGWLALQEHYFLSAWIPENKERIYNYFSDHYAGEFYVLGLADDNISVAANEKGSTGANLYVGPEIAKNLSSLAPNLDLTIDYGWLKYISIALFWLMDQINKIVGNWGWSIVIVTIIIKALFYKLTESTFKSTARMKELAPKLQALKERYANDRQKLSQATMELYKKEKINPVGGCLPMLLQIPFFIALYYVLVEAVQLRQAPFIFWIHDISAKDPYYVLPILMGLSMLLQQKLSPASPDPAQAKMMMFLPVVFTIFFLSFPSGLVLYWFVNNCLTVLQQWYINEKIAKESARAKKARR